MSNERTVADINKLVSMTLDGINDTAPSGNVIDIQNYFEQRSGGNPMSARPADDDFLYEDDYCLKEIGLNGGTLILVDNVKYTLSSGLELPINLEFFSTIFNKRSITSGMRYSIKNIKNELSFILSSYLGVDVYAVGFIESGDDIEFYLLDSVKDVSSFEQIVHSGSNQKAA